MAEVWRKCSVFGCKGDRHIHRVPRKNVELTKIWYHRCCRTDNLKMENVRICKKHFEDSCYQRDLRHELLGEPTKCMLKPGSVPTLNLPKSLPVSATSANSSDRSQRLQKRATQAEIRTVLSQPTPTTTTERLSLARLEDMQKEYSALVKKKVEKPSPDVAKLELENKALKAKLYSREMVIKALQAELRLLRLKLVTSHPVGTRAQGDRPEDEAAQTPGSVPTLNLPKSLPVSATSANSDRSEDEAAQKPEGTDGISGGTLREGVDVGVELGGAGGVLL